MEEEYPDTIKHPRAFKESEPEGFDGACDFKKTAENINLRGITPMDIDLVVEINCHFLIHETKQDGVAVPPGQRQSLENLRKAKSITLVYRWPKKRPAQRIEILYHNGERRFYEGDAAESMLAKLEKKWSKKANADDLKTICSSCRHEILTDDYHVVDKEIVCNSCYSSTRDEDYEGDIPF